MSAYPRFSGLKDDPTRTLCNSGPQCPKCRSFEIDVTYCTRGEADYENEVVDNRPAEFLRRRCGDCGWSWPEMCDDHEEKA